MLCQYASLPPLHAHVPAGLPSHERCAQASHSQRGTRCRLPGTDELKMGNQRVFFEAPCFRGEAENSLRRLKITLRGCLFLGYFDGYSNLEVAKFQKEVTKFSCWGRLRDWPPEGLQLSCFAVGKFSSTCGSKRVGLVLQKPQNTCLTPSTASFTTSRPSS